MEDLGRVYEEFKVRAKDLVAKVRDLIHEGNVRRVIIKDEHGVTFMEIPLSVATVSAILAPVLAAVGAIAALLSNFTLVVERAERGAGPERAAASSAHATSGFGATAKSPVAVPSVDAGASSGQLVPLRGASARVAQNMEASLSMPLASSQRTIPVKVIDENRRIINQHRPLVGKSKVSYTHLIGWAVVKALKSHPGINNAYVENQGQPFRLVRERINLGVAVDVEGRDGTRNLVVPN